MSRKFYQLKLLSAPKQRKKHDGSYKGVFQVLRARRTAQNAPEANVRSFWAWWHTHHTPTLVRGETVSESLDS